MLALADELQIELEKYVDQHKLLKSIYFRLVEHARNHKRVLLCIDEAQAMPLETMEALRLLTNLETEKRKLMQIVLFGQPELNRKLEEPSIRQLTQRITFHYNIGPLSATELDDYIAHRLAVAGYEREHRLFNERAIRRLHRASGGIPRVANILAHKALLVAFGQGTRDITAKHVRAAANDTLAATRRPFWWWPFGALTLSIVSVLGFAWAYLK
jgi:MSHA biogenesis protein MshM